LNGVPALLPTDAKRDEQEGYVVVNESSMNDPDAKILEKVVIPKSKWKTYGLLVKLLDNYELDAGKKETVTNEEKEETREFINAIQATTPMQLAREYIETQPGMAKFTDDSWHKYILKTWFTTFSVGDSPDRSGFEHVFVGEKKGSNVGGYHFWYKYYIDDKGPGDEDDIKYVRTKYTSDGTGELEETGRLVPDIVTIQYKWEAEPGTWLEKKRGGFWVGCSPEGLMALGLVRNLNPKSNEKVVINNIEYDLALFDDSSGKSINTFYPKFIKIKMSDPPLNTVRIYSALVNPEGADEGKETVTLINTGSLPVNIKGWKIAGNNKKTYELVDNEDDVDTTLAGSEKRTYTLPKGTAQLVNKKARITLTNASGEEVSVVNYTSRQAKSNHPILF